MFQGDIEGWKDVRVHPRRGYHDDGDDEGLWIGEEKMSLVDEKPELILNKRDENLLLHFLFLQNQLGKLNQCISGIRLPVLRHHTHSMIIQVEVLAHLLGLPYDVRQLGRGMRTICPVQFVPVLIREVITSVNPEYVTYLAAQKKDEYNLAKKKCKWV